MELRGVQRVHSGVVPFGPLFLEVLAETEYTRQEPGVPLRYVADVVCIHPKAVRRCRQVCIFADWSNSPNSLSSGLILGL